MPNPTSINRFDPNDSVARRGRSILGGSGGWRCIPTLGVLAVLLLVAGCSTDPTQSDEYMALEEELTQSETQLLHVTAERDELESELAAAATEMASLQAQLDADLSQDAEQVGWTVADLSEWEEAFESGDYDRVRALFTDDGIITTPRQTIGLYYGDTTKLGTWDVNGSEFRRIATLHPGEDHTVLGTPIQVDNNTIAFGWSWSSGLSGTAVLRLRDGKVVVAVLNTSQVPIPFQGES